MEEEIPWDATWAPCSKASPALVASLSLSTLCQLDNRMERIRATPGSSQLWLQVGMASFMALSLQKCFHYWPEKEGTYGPFTIRVQGVNECAEYLLRDLSIQVGPSPVLGPAGDPGNVPTPPGSLASLSAPSLFAPCLKAHRCSVATLGWLHGGCGDSTGAAAPCWGHATFGMEEGSWGTAASPQQGIWTP